MLVNKPMPGKHQQWGWQRTTNTNTHRHTHTHSHVLTHIHTLICTHTHTPTYIHTFSSRLLWEDMKVSIGYTQREKREMQGNKIISIALACSLWTSGFEWSAVVGIMTLTPHPFFSPWVGARNLDPPPRPFFCPRGGGGSK